jgi:hypothetical protein
MLFEGIFYILSIWAGGVTQVVHLPSKHEALSSNHSTAKKKKIVKILDIF